MLQELDDNQVRLVSDKIDVVVDKHISTVRYALAALSEAVAYQINKRYADEETRQVMLQYFWDHLESDIKTMSVAVPEPANGNNIAAVA